MESNVPATTQEPAVPATIDQAPTEAPTRPGQNVMTGLFPLAIGVLVLLFLVLALWTLMTVTPSGV